MGRVEELIAASDEARELATEGIRAAFGDATQFGLEVMSPELGHAPIIGALTLLSVPEMRRRLDNWRGIVGDLLTSERGVPHPVTPGKSARRPPTTRTAASALRSSLRVDVLQQTVGIRWYTNTLYCKVDCAGANR